jgi:hypothetical protein
MRRMPLDILSSVAQELDTIETSAMGFGRLVACTIVVEEESLTLLITWDQAKGRWYVEVEDS